MNRSAVRRRSRALVAVVGLVAAAVSFAVVVPTTPEPAAAAATCAVPGDCRMWEAARSAGVHFGLASSNGSAQHRATFAAEADLVVNHEFSWSGIEPDRGVWDFTKADENYQWAEDHGMHQIAMHFAWDQVVLDDMPGWVGAITDPDELRSVLRTRAQVLFARYPGIDRIDVVNEPFQTLGHELERNHFFEVLGPDYIDQLFTIVEEEAPPSVELFVNEGGIEYQPRKADALVALVTHLHSTGHRVDGVGLQSHLDVGEPDWNTLLSAMQRLDALGVKPFISEIDLPVPSIVPDRRVEQARRFRTAAEICLMVPSCDVFDVWGVSDVDTWLNWGFEPGTEPLLFDDQFQPKPSYFAVRDAFLAGRLPAHPFPVTTTAASTRGSLDVTYAYECRAVGTMTTGGLAVISNVESIFVGGNPIRIPVPARLTWTAATGPSTPIDRTVALDVDLATVAARYREETARPAVSLGGYQALKDTVWLRLAADHLAFHWGPLPGAGSTGAPVISSTGPASSGTASAVSGMDVRLGRVVADTRDPVTGFTVSSSWTERPATGGWTPGATLVAAAPTLAFDLTADLGVVANGISAFGRVGTHVACAAVGAVTVAATVVAAPAPTSTLPVTTPVAAVAVTASPSLAG